MSNCGGYTSLHSGTGSLVVCVAYYFSTYSLFERCQVGKRVKFNVQDIFLDGQNDPADRTFFVSSPLFSAFASLYNRSGGLS